jgi:hypothetical protein
VSPLTHWVPFWHWMPIGPQEKEESFCCYEITLFTSSGAGMKICCRCLRAAVRNVHFIPRQTAVPSERAAAKHPKLDQAMPKLKAPRGLHHRPRLSRTTTQPAIQHPNSIHNYTTYRLRLTGNTVIASLSRVFTRIHSSTAPLFRARRRKA